MSEERSARAGPVSELLLEIGCEEIPAPWLPELAAQMRAVFIEAASQEHVAPSEVRALWTPRRLVLSANVLRRQEDREEATWGPALKVAKDAAGHWTKAAEGFAKKFGVGVDSLRVASKSGLPPSAGDPVVHLVYVRQVAGRSASEILPDVIAHTLRSLSFPKRMSWDAWLEDGKGAFPFGRPIRWLVALLDGEVVPFEINSCLDGGKGNLIVRSGAETRGHRFLPRGRAGAPIPVRSLADLKEKLRQNYVVLDPDERGRLIRDGLAAVGKAPRDDHGLVDEWRDLVEYPTVVSGRIPAEFRSLPTEVLQTVLVHHQKYIPLVSSGAVDAFAAVTNSDGTNSAEIVRGMERVVVARLRDAAFFFAEDRKRPLRDRVADLAGVTFHKELGSYREKIARMVALVDLMGAQMGILTKPEHEVARAAAELCKADLTTLMVREFPELQGIMGGIYLRAEGQSWPNVAQAVQWHYHPISIEEGSPPAQALVGSDATVFAAVSLADKLDTLAGYFGLRLRPTGSSDPYGLRRAAQGAVRVVLDFWQADVAEQRPNLRRLVEAAVAGYGQPQVEVLRDLEEFLLDRLESVLTSRGFPVEEVQGVLFTPGTDALQDPYDCLVRLKALHRVRSEAKHDFEHLAVAFKRAKNILQQQVHTAQVEPELFESDAERELYAAVNALADSDSRGYETRLRALAGLRAPVDRFFDDVLVMAENLNVRSNRLGLLSRTLSLFYRIADISKLGG